LAPRPEAKVATKRTKESLAADRARAESGDGISYGFGRPSRTSRKP
jgi:hypothetical protein